MNRLDSISDSTGTLVACTYLGAGQIVKETDAGATLSYLNTDGTNVTGLDRFGRVLDQLWSDYSQTPSVPVDHYTYTYDRAGNRHTDHNLLHEDFNETFTYDDLDRLATSVRADGHDQSWGLDGLGNFGTFTNDSDVQTRDASPANEIGNVTGGTVTPTYDTAGNMISGPSSGDETVRVHYTYDAWNRLVEVRADSAQNPGQPGDLIATYKYDGANHRVEKTVYDLSIGDPTATTDYYYNQQWQVVEERMLPAGENQSTVVTQYVWDQSYIDTPVVRFRGSETLYYTTDANHNVTSLVDPAGEVVERYVYDAYGKVTFCGGLWTPLTTGGNNSTTRSGVSSAYVNEVLYCGYRYDPETSLVISTTVATAGNYQDRNRELITTLSTFDVRDPIGIATGMNLYAYVGDNPLVWRDPSGFCCEGECQVSNVKKESKSMVTINTDADSWGGKSLVDQLKDKGKDWLKDQILDWISKFQDVIDKGGVCGVGGLLAGGISLPSRMRITSVTITLNGTISADVSVCGANGKFGPPKQETATASVTGGMSGPSGVGYVMPMDGKQFANDVKSLVAKLRSQLDGALSNNIGCNNQKQEKPSQPSPPPSQPPFIYVPPTPPFPPDFDPRPYWP